MTRDRWLHSLKEGDLVVVNFVQGERKDGEKGNMIVPVYFDSPYFRALRCLWSMRDGTYVGASWVGKLDSLFKLDD
jgi:hypothetical protein